MKHNIIAGFFALLFFAFACQSPSTDNTATTTTTSPSSDEDNVTRGEYLVTIMNCHFCHSPKKSTGLELVIDETRMLSGHPSDLSFPSINKSMVGPNKMVVFNDQYTAVAGPWGISFAANITSAGTGIGAWSYGQFVTAIKHGKFKGMETGRDLLPPMPWREFSNLKESDLRAIYDYLKTIPAVENSVPAPIAYGDVK